MVSSGQWMSASRVGVIRAGSSRKENSRWEIMRDELLELERQLARAEKTLPFVPPGEYEQTRAQLEEIRDTIYLLKTCPELQRVQ
jgi:hypothetical protein